MCFVDLAFAQFFLHSTCTQQFQSFYHYRSNTNQFIKVKARINLIIKLRLLVKYKLVFPATKIIIQFHLYQYSLNSFIIILKQPQQIITQMAEKDFVMLTKLGEGSFGQVYKVKRISDDTEYAMKKVKILDMKERDKNNALNQIRLLASIQHENIVSYKQAFYDQTTKKLCTVMELAQNGDLSSKIKNKTKKSQFFYEFQIWSIGLGILKGLQALHNLKIIHRDIKPANIFFGAHDIPKLGDMNVSILLNKDLAYTQTGTPYYASPEVWNNEPYSFECDIWSFGCILYEMCTFRPPFKGKNMDALFQKIQRCQYQKISKRYSPELQQAISMCLKPKYRRAKIAKLVEIFKKHQPPGSSKKLLTLKKSNNSQNLLRTIKMPSNKDQLKNILPKSKYKSSQPQFSTLEQDELDSREHSTSLGKRQSQRQNSMRKPISLGSSKSLKRLQKNPSAKSLLSLFSIQSKNSVQLTVRKSYLDNIGNVKITPNISSNIISNIKSQILLSNDRSQKYLRDYVNLNKNPSFQNILQSPKISTIQKMSVERLNLKRRKLRMALNY